MFAFTSMPSNGRRVQIQFGGHSIAINTEDGITLSKLISEWDTNVSDSSKANSDSDDSSDSDSSESSDSSDSSDSDDSSDSSDDSSDSDSSGSSDSSDSSDSDSDDSSGSDEPEEQDPDDTKSSEKNLLEIPGIVTRAMAIYAITGGIEIGSFSIDQVLVMGLMSERIYNLPPHKGNDDDVWKKIAVICQKQLQHLLQNQSVEIIYPLIRWMNEFENQTQSKFSMMKTVILDFCHRHIRAFVQNKKEFLSVGMDLMQQIIERSLSPYVPLKLD